MTGLQRIWAKAHGASTDVLTGKRGLLGGWNEHPREGQREYIRADIHDEVVKALREAVEIVHKAYVSATMEAVNAGPNHPLAKQMDAWRARCMMAEIDARAALARTGEG